MDLSIYKAKPDKSIREHTDEVLKNLETMQMLGYIKEHHIYKLMMITCEYHDYGKANREFQKRINTNSKFDERKEIAHNVLSLCFIDKKEFEDTEDYYKVGFAVLNHHDYCKNIEILQNSECQVLINDLLKDFGLECVSRRVSVDVHKKAEDKDTILIKGFLHKCDYSASAGIPVEHINDFLDDGLEHHREVWKEKDSNADWNELQQYCRANTDKNIVVNAQTGMGKTEAGLLWIGNNKGFFILPLRTAINSIYDRVKTKILSNCRIESKLALLHSDSLSYYRNNSDDKEMDIIDYHTKSRQLSIPLSISTLDQLFDFVFKYQGYELKLATLSYSKIVIDEIQMYGADLLAYLIYGIKAVNKFGGKIAILTATLAPFVKDLLREGKDGIEFEDKIFINDMERHNIKVYNSKIDSGVIYKKYLEIEEKHISNKILVVCNTVKRAQQIYKELEKKEITNTNILHSKFIKCERNEKEKEIIEFGETEHEGSCIWIATQIVEASLDIDFDYLFTELSDINGLFQRIGRCNRKGVKAVEQPNCFVFSEIDKNLLTNGDKGFIDKDMYELSHEALKDVNGVLTEKKKIEIINKYLTTERLTKSDYLRKYRKYYKYIEELTPYEIEKRDIMFRNIIAYDVIPNPVYITHKDELDENLDCLSKATNKLDKFKLIEGIRKYTVQVGRYDIYRGKKSAVVKSIKLGKYETINIIDCKYDKLGFRRVTNDEIKGIEPSYDNFL